MIVGVLLDTPQYRLSLTANGSETELRLHNRETGLGTTLAIPNSFNQLTEELPKKFISLEALKKVYALGHSSFYFRPSLPDNLFPENLWQDHSDEIYKSLESIKAKVLKERSEKK